MSLPPNSLPEELPSIPVPEAQLEAPTEVVLPPEKRFPAWSGWDLFWMVIFTLVSIFVCTMVALFVAHSLPQLRNASFTDLAMNAEVVIGAQTAAYPIVLLFIFFLVRSRSEEGFGEAIRWHWPRSSAPAFVVGGIVLAIAVQGLARLLPIPKSLPMDAFFKDPMSAYIMAVFGITMAPLMEEIFFRGLMYPLLRRWFGLVTAVLGTALAFAAIHGAQLGYAWAPVLSIFIVGVVFTLVRVKTDSVASSFLMHCGYNFSLFAALWIASDHFRHLDKVTG